MKFIITLDSYEFNTLLKIAAEAQQEGKIQWSLTNTILKATEIKYEPENEGA